METSFTKAYQFPNEDICLFKEFPHTNLALPIVIFDQPASCTCTLKLLQMHYNAYKSILTITNDYEMFYNDSKNYIRYIKYIYRFCAQNQDGDCDFVDIFNRCNITHKQKKQEVNDQDVYFIVKWLQYILLTVLQPLFSAVGLLNNLLILITVRIRRRKSCSIFQFTNTYKYTLSLAFSIVLSQFSRWLPRVLTIIARIHFIVPRFTHKNGLNMSK